MTLIPLTRGPTAKLLHSLTGRDEAPTIHIAPAAPHHDAPMSDAPFRALEAMPGYWAGRAIGRRQATDCMDLSRDTLADHKAIADYERRAAEAA